MFSSMSVASTPSSSLQQREVEGEELDAPWLDIRKPSIDTHARLHEPINVEGLPSECNLFDVSSKKGVFVAAGTDAFSLYSLESLETLFTTAPRSTTSPLVPIKTVPLGERLVWIKFAKEDSVVITSTSSSTIRIFSVEALKSEQAPQPLQSFPSLPSPIISLQPNPEALPSLVLILQAASLSLLDVDSQTETMRLEGRYTAATWSPKGKQVVVGDEQGRLRFFGPDGSEKGLALERPSGLEGDYFVNSIHWLENDVFLVTYNLPLPPGSSDPEHSYELYILTRSKVPTPSVTCTHFPDPSPAFGLTSRAGVRYGAFLSSWGGKGNWLGFLGNAPSPLLGVVSASAQDGGWKVLTLDETSVPSIPLSESSSEDSCVLGMGFDLRTSLPIKRGMVGGEEWEDLPAAPRLLVYTSDGVLAGWNVVNSRPGVGAYEGMVKESSGGEISMAGTPARVASPPPPPAPPASAFAGFGSSPSTSAFGAPIKAPSSAFGAPTFGQPASTTGSAFGQTSAFGAAIKPPTTTSAFGAPSAFGQTSSFGAPASSSSAFGTPTKPPATSSGFGAFSSSPSTTPTAKPAFGGFGSNAFGAPSTFGSTSTFGAAATTKTPAEEKKASPFSGGFGAFSTSPSPSPSPAAAPAVAPASPSPVPAFGKPASTAFGAFGSSSSSAFGSTSTFGSSSSTSAFGASPSSTPAAASSAFGSTSKPSSAFGSTSTFGAPSAFGAAKPIFGASTIAGPKIAPVVASTGAFGAFAAPATSTGGSAFGSASASPFGAAAKGGEGFGGLLASPGGTPSTEPAKSAFGGFGKPAQTSAFGSAPLSSAFTGFGGGAASSSSSSPFAGVPLPKTTDASMPSTPLVSPSAEQPPKPSAFSFGARPAATLDDDDEEDSKKGKGSAFDDDLGDDLEPSEEAKKSGSSSDLFGGGGTSFGFGGLGGGKSTSGGSGGGMFGSVAQSNSISVQFNEDDEDDEEEEPVGEEQEEEEEEEEYDEEAEGSYSEGEGEEADQGEEVEGSGEEEEVEGVSENPSSTSLPTIVADGVKIEELPEESPTKVPLPPSATPSPAPPSPQPQPQTPASPPPEPAVEPTSTILKSSPPSPATPLFSTASLQQPALDRSSAPSPEPESKAVEKEVVEAPKPSFGLFGQPKPATAPSPLPSTTIPASALSPPPLFGAKPSPTPSASFTPPAAPSELPKTTPSPPPPSKPPMFGSKPMFGGKGFPSTAPIRSSPLASPPIMRSDDLDKSTASSVASPPPSPEPTKAAPQPFSFGSKPTQSPAEQTNPFGGSTTPLAKPKSGGLGLGLPSSQPSKPSAPPSFGFGAPPSQPPKVEPAPAPANPAFGGWGAPPPAPSLSKAAPGPPMTFGGFGQPKPLASTPSPSFFGAPPPPAAVEPPKAPSPSLFGAPSTPNKASQPPANLFGSTTPQSKPPTFSSPAMFAPAPQKLAPPPPPSFQPPTTPKGFPPTLSGSTTPKIESPAPVKPAFPQRTSTGPKSSNAPEVKETGLAGEFLKAYLLLNQEISDLQTAARSYSQFQREAGKPSSQVGDLDTQPAWTLGDLPRLRSLAKAKEEDTLSLTDESFMMKRKIAELQSLMLKADTKMEESARFLRARDDPDFAKMIRVRQLGPEHTENQQKLRKTTQLVRDRVLQLENHLAVLKKRVGQEKSGSVPMKAPSLDTIARTMRNITVAVNEKTYEIDDLELRLDVLRLTSKKTTSTPLSDASNTTSPLRSALNRSAVNPKVASIAARALNDERKSFQVKASILAARKEPLFNQSMAAKEAPSSSSSRSGGDVLLSRTPVKFEALPSPRRAAPPKAVAPVASSSKAPGPSNPFGNASTSFSAGPTPSSSLGWGSSSSISLSAFATPTPNPNNPSSLFPTQPTFSGLPPDEFVPLCSGREMDSRRRPKGVQHTSAPRARTSPASSPNPPVPSSSAFSFGPPPPLSSARAPGSGLMTFEGLQPPTPIKKAPSNFFSSSSSAAAPSTPANEEEGDEYEEDGDGEEYDEEEFDEEEEWEGEEDYSYEGEEGDQTQ